jgi:uncharacterized membrane protein YidH (DUF202 family)
MTSADESTRKNLIEQYRLYVEMADRVSQRRIQTNQFYIALLSALLVILTFVAGNTLYSNISRHAVCIVSVVGILLCCVWTINIKSYSQLNKGKFQVIHELEAFLPFSGYGREWELLTEGKDGKIYRPLTHVEKYLSIIMAVVFLILFVCTILG